MGEFGKFEVVIFLVLGLVASTHADDIITGLKVGYYNNTCPNAEDIVRQVINDYIPHGRPSLAASLVRLHFHDCFVEGCDASVMLNYTKRSGSKTERVSPINLSLRGFDVIELVKSKLEAACPGVVSCADIIALAARDALASINGSYWEVATGRRDGTESSFTKPVNELPFPVENITSLKIKFKNKGLDLTDLVLLSGAHTIGKSHCTSFTTRLFNFTGVGDQDPSLDTTYATELKEKCPALNSTGNVSMDPQSEKTFDLSYYNNLVEHKNLFSSDGALLTSSETKSTVYELLNGDEEHFKQEFAKAMVKMGKIGVKTGSAGEVRKKCASVN